MPRIYDHLSIIMKWTLVESENNYESIGIRIQKMAEYGDLDWTDLGT